MKKKLASMLLVVALILTMLPATAMAASGLSIKITATPASAAVGDTVNFTISVNAATPKDFGGIEFKLDIPSGLEYQSGTFDSDFKTLSQADADCSYTEAERLVIATTSDGFENLTNLSLMTFSCKVAEGASSDLNVSIKDVVISDRQFDEVSSSGYTITPATVTIGSGAPAATPVTAANFTLDASTYAIGSKIGDLKVSGTNTGLAAVGSYGTGYVICKDAEMTNVPDSDDTFAAETDYYLVVTLQAEAGYTLTGLKASDVKLGTKTANEVRLSSEDSTKGGAIFKLDQLTAPVSDSYTVTFNAGDGTGTMAPVTVPKAATGDTKWTIPECTFTAPDGKAFQYWTVTGSDSGAYLSKSEIKLTGDITLTAQWGTPVTAVNFTLVGYAKDALIKNIKVTPDTATDAVLYNYTDEYYSGDYAIGTDSAVLTGDFSSLIKKDSDAVFAVGTDYYLAVILEADYSYSFKNLTAANVKVGDISATKLLPAEGDGSMVTFAIFKLDQLTAPAHTHTYDQENRKADGALKSAADCQHKAVYYKSCACGAVSTDPADTFQYGEKDPANHTEGCVKGTEWQKDSTYHWHVYSKCGAQADKTSHLYNQQTANETTLKSAANCQSKAVYYKSCACGAVSTDSADTFQYGEKNSDNHTGAPGTEWKHNDTHHWHEYTCCGAESGKAVHTFTDDSVNCTANCGATHKLTQNISASNVSATYGDDKSITVTGAKTGLSFDVTEGEDVVAVNGVGKLTLKKAGTATIKITAAANDTYYGDETTVTVTVAKKEIEIEGAYPISRPYEKDNLTMDVLSVGFKGLVGTPTLQKGTDYTVNGTVETDSAASPKNYTITVELKGMLDTNYVLKSNTYQSTFTIYPADPTAPTNLTGKTGDKLSSVTLPDGWSWIAPDTTMSEAGDKQFAAKYVDTTGNYKDVASKNLTVNVTDKTPQSISASDVTATYGDTNKAISASLTTGNGALSYAVKSGNDVVDVAADGKLTIKLAGTAVVTVTAAETATYAKAEKDVTITVSAKALTIVAKNQKIYVNGTLPDLTKADAYTVTGLVNGDTLDISLEYSEAPDVTKTGSYEIEVSVTVDTAKYEVTTHYGTLTIVNRPVSGGSSAVSYTITVEDAKNGSVTADRKTAEEGETITLTVDPDKGYDLADLTVLDKDGKAVKVTQKSGKYTFTMPASKVTVKAAFAKENTFVDVPADAYYADAVLWAAENGVTGGVDDTHFAPDAACTRAQTVMFLWRAAGSPEAKTVSEFADVPADAYYAKAVAWAVEQGITSGIGDGKFGPDVTCTRAQCMMFLWRMMGSPAVSGSASFTDVAADAYYADAVAWAVEQGVTSGIGDGLFGSDNNCTRAQIVMFLYRSAK